VAATLRLQRGLRPSFQPGWPRGNGRIRCSITATACEVGYNSPGALTAAFHRTLGFSPGQYRNCWVWSGLL